MSDFEDREKAFEGKFAYDQELMFKIEARACKLFGGWVAEKLGLAGDEAKTFAASLVAANLDEPGFDDVKRAVRESLSGKAVDISDHAMDTQLEHFMEEAKNQIVSEK